MSVQAEFIASTGAYQHVKLTVEAADGVGLMKTLAGITDEMKIQLGVFEAEFVSWTSDTYSKAIDGQEIDAVKMVAESLGATVVEETNVPDARALTDAELEHAAAAGPGDIQEKALAEMDRRAKETKQKPWEQKSPTASTSLDDF